MVSLDRRADIAVLIGKEVEELVYFYCACDRDFTYEELLHGSLNDRNRFTGKIYRLTKEQAQDLSELTVANAFELVVASKEFKAQCDNEFFALFEDLNFLLAKAQLSHIEVQWPSFHDSSRLWTRKRPRECRKHYVHS